jgi:hypothetical protein
VYSQPSDYDKFLLQTLAQRTGVTFEFIKAESWKWIIADRRRARDSWAAWWLRRGGLFKQ